MQKVTNLLTVIILASLTTFAASCDGDSDDGACDTSEDTFKECTCENDATGLKSCELIEDSEDAEWGECVCADRYARVCNTMGYTDSNTGDPLDGICTVTMKAGGESYTFDSVISGLCDQPKGEFCQPMPAGNDLLMTLTCYPEGIPEEEQVVFTDAPLTLTDTGVDHVFIIYYDPNFQSLSIFAEPFPAADPATGEPDAIQECKNYTIESDV